MALKTSNNVKKIISIPALATDLTITLVDVHGLPDITAVGDYMILTFIRLSDLKQEIVRVDDVTGTVLTVQRAQEGTIALDLLALDEVRNFFTSAMFMETSALANRALAETAATNAAASETNAAASEALAEDWANEAEDVEVTGGLFSAFHWAQKALLGFMPVATELIRGGLKIATQALTDAGTDDETIITPLKLQTRLDTVVGGLVTPEWAFSTVLAGVVTVVDSSGISSVVRDSKGLYTFTFTTPLPNTLYIVNVMMAAEEVDGERTAGYQFATKATTGFQLRITTVASAVLEDPTVLDVSISRQV